MNKTTSVYSSFLWKPRFVLSFFAFCILSLFNQICKNSRREDQKKQVVCEASQYISGKKTSAHLTVDLLYAPDRPIVSIVGGDSFVRVGDNVTVVCIVRGGNPRPHFVSWYVNELPVSNRFEFDSNAQVLLSMADYLRRSKLC